MNTARQTFFFALTSLALGCGSSVTIISYDAGNNPSDLGLTPDDRGQSVVDAPADAGRFCLLSDGTHCAWGQVCQSPTDCNLCMCMEGHTGAGCGARFCAPDAGPGCTSSTDCGTGYECRVTDPGCGMVGTCRTLTDCASVQAYCGCDGTTFMDCPSAPQRPFASRGACATDGGVSPDAAVCAGASIGVNGMYCAGPADGPLPLDCCYGWDCNGAHALCNLAPPPCEPGYTHLIAGGCYGECVRADHCAGAR